MQRLHRRAGQSGFDAKTEKRSTVVAEGAILRAHPQEAARVLRDGQDFRFVSPSSRPNDRNE